MEDANEIGAHDLLVCMLGELGGAFILSALDVGIAPSVLCMQDQLSTLADTYDCILS